jgi:hypothetical protein
MRSCTALLLLLCLLGRTAAQRTKPPSAPASVSGATEPVPATFFGLHINHAPSKWPPFAFGSYRFWDDGARWQLIETAPDRFEWKVLDYWIEKISSHGVKDVAYPIGGSPPWAVDVQGGENCDYGTPGRARSPGPGFCKPPRDLNSDGTGSNLIWRKAVTAIGEHFQKSPVRVSNWEVWQEFIRRGGENLTAAWIGTNQQLVRLSEDTRCIVTGRGRVTETNETCEQVLRTVGRKEPLDPDSIIVSPSGGLGLKVWVQRFAEYWETPGAAESSDVVGLHLYPSQPEEIFDRFEAWHTTLPKAVAAKPIWLTEGGWHRNSITDPDMQMAFVSRFHLLARGIAAGRVYWYSYDTPTQGELLDTKAGDAYQRVYEWMVGNTLTRCGREGSVYSCSLTRSDGTPMLAVWDVSRNCSDGRCSTSNYRVPRGFTVYFTLDDANSMPVRGGTVQIGAKPILLSGK